MKYQKATFSEVAHFVGLLTSLLLSVLLFVVVSVQDLIGWARSTPSTRAKREREVEDLIMQKWRDKMDKLNNRGVTKQ